MSTMTFQINDTINGSAVAVWVTATEQMDGTLRFDVTQSGGLIGDLRGLFFDMADESIIKSLTVTSAVAGLTELKLGNDTVKDLGDGANMNGLLGGTGGTDTAGYDVGIEIGTAGIGKDDYRSFSFVLDSSLRDLTLSDISNTNFGARLTSVGIEDGSRSDSSKLLETTSTAINANADSLAISENSSVSGNVLANDKTGLPATDTINITGWNGGALGNTITLHNAAGATLTLNADGTYVLDASTANALSEGENLTYSFTYDAKAVNETTSWSTDSAAFTVAVTGKNDGPDANNDAVSTTENTNLSGSILTNDQDVDRLDTISVTGWSGGNLGQVAELTNGAGATVTLNADGTYVLDASTADTLSAGETITQNFSYTIADNHGATNTATLSVTVTGQNDGPNANNDAVGRIDENATLFGNVAVNDTDIDRLDTHAYALAAAWDGPGTLTFNNDGTWSYNSGDLANFNDGEELHYSFDYVMTDNHGASDTATVTFSIDGKGTAAAGFASSDNSTSSTATDIFPHMQQAISNVVLYLDDGNKDTGLIKLKISPASGQPYYDVDNLDIDGFIATHGDVLGKNTDLVGISIHAGQEYPNVNGVDGTAPGEGVFYFLGDSQVVAVGTHSLNGWVQDWSKDSIPLDALAMDAGFTDTLLQQQAPNFSFDGNWFV